MDLKNNNIPKEWFWITFNESINKISTNNIKLKQKNYLENGKYPVIDQGEKFIGGYSNNQNLLIKVNSPLIIFGDHTKIIKFINFDFIPGADGIKVLKPYSFFNKKLFYYFIHCLKIPNKGYARHYQFLKNNNIPLPPLPEQNEIVTRIESLLSNLDAGVESLKKTKEQIKTYKQSVLKWAFEGRLTNGVIPVDANGSILVDANGRSHLQGWKWVKLGEIAISINPGFPSGKHNIEKKGFPHIRPMNIDYYGKIDLTVIKYIEIENFKKLTKKDILFNNTNSPELLGKTTYIDKDTNWAYSNHMTRIRIKDNNLYKYVAFYLHFLFWIGYYKMHCTNHVNQASINKSFLENKVEIPLPPLPEQKTIVSEIERRFSAVEKFEQMIDKSLEKSKILRQSILKKAFNGELTEKWRKEHQELVTGENSAKRLLERIREEKESV